MRCTRSRIRTDPADFRGFGFANFTRYNPTCELLGCGSVIADVMSLNNQRIILLSHSDWNSLRSGIEQIGEELTLRGGKVDTPCFYPPRDIAEIAEFEAATKLSLPNDFSHFLTELCGGWEFSWNLPEAYDDDNVADIFNWFPSWCPDQGRFIGQSQFSVLEHYQTLVALIYEWVEHGGVDESDFQIAKNCFPLYHCACGSNFVAIRLDTEINEVVYLSHDEGFHVTTDRVMGRGFTRFTQNYARLGCPDLDCSLPIYDDNREIDFTKPVLQKWESWLGA